MKRTWLVLLCFLFALAILSGCGENSREQVLRRYGVEMDEQGQYVWRNYSGKWHGELVCEEDGRAVFYGCNHNFERYFDAYGNILYDVGTDNVNTFGEKMNINNWAAAAEPWPENAPILLPENAYAVNIISFSAFNYNDEPPQKARIGKLSPDELEAYIRLLEKDGWQKRFDAGRMATAPAELTPMVKWYLGEPGAGDIILEKESAFVIVEPVGNPEYYAFDVTFCYARLPDSSPLPLPDGATVEYAIVAPHSKELHRVRFAFDEAYGAVEEQMYLYLISLETSGILKFGSLQSRLFNSVKTDKYGLVGEWHGEYIIEGNFLMFDIDWQY